MNSLLSFFPTIVYNDNLEISEDLSRSIKSLSYIRTNNDNGFISADYKIFNNHELKDICSTIENHCKRYFYDILKLQRQFEFQIVSSWANKHESNDFAQEHYHSNSMFTGILCISIPQNSGELCFHHPLPNFGSTFEFNYSARNNFNSNIIKIFPSDGDLFIFPSSLKHSVSKNNSEKDRYTIAFNIFFSGLFGNHETELRL